MKGSALRFAFSLLMIAAVVSIWLTLDWVLEKHERYMPDPTDPAYHEGRGMTARDHLLTVRYPREEVGPVTFYLLARRATTLLAILYVLAALAGWCGSIWLQMLRRRDGPGFLPSLLLAALAGLVTFLLVTIVIALRPNLASIRSALSVVAIMAGLFVTTFYEELEKLLRDSFKWLRKQMGGGSDQEEPPKSDDDQNRAAAIFLTAAIAAVAAGYVHAGTLFQCVDPKTPMCTASTEAGKAKCPHTCNRWIETDLTKSWLAALQSEANGTAANWTLDAVSQDLYDSDLFDGAPPKIRTVWSSPEKFGLQTVKRDDVSAGTLVLLPNLTAVVTEAAPNPLDATVIYPSAAMGGKPNETTLRNLIDGATPKFVIPEGVMNAAVPATAVDRDDATR